MSKIDGKFEEGNKAAEKWTLEESMNLGYALIDWMKAKDDNGEDKGNIFYEDFLCIENDYYEDLISYLCKKFNPFLDLIKKAKKIQELKLIKFGIADRLQPTMTIFVLKNHHNYKDKQEIEITIKTELSEKELDERIKELEEKRK